MKVGVIIGRWQIDRLHEGHIWLIEEVKKKCDKLVFLIGEPIVSYTNRNPLTYFMRKCMLQKSYPEAEVYCVVDRPNDDDYWSYDVDNILKIYDDVTLYGSRDSFIKHYKGDHPVVEFPCAVEMSATQLRKEIGDQKLFDTCTTEFRRGVIHAIENRFPTAYPTVDVVPIRLYGQYDDIAQTQILLGRKPGKTKFRFIGGFVDPTDDSIFGAAARELKEEAGDVLTHEFFFIASHKIFDERYRGTKDGIITTLVGTYVMGGNPVAGDDIEEVKWFDVSKISTEDLEPLHHILFSSLLKHINKNK